MRRILSRVTGLTALALIVACAGQTTETTHDSDGGSVESNVLLAAWTGPYGGVPAFDKMELEVLKPALEAGMEKHLAEIDEIAQDTAEPTFENTIVAMERVGKDLDRVFAYYGVWSANRTTPEFREVQQEMAPKLSEFRSKITQNTQLFSRIKTVYESRLRP